MITDPFHHLAVEDALLDLPGDAPPVLRLWRARPSVVIGKNQIPWREADLGWMQREGVMLCRRVSGGGAVYQDEGNLNWSFCIPRLRYSAGAVTAACVRALAAAGVQAAPAGAASLVSDGAKISGMAYAYRRDRVLHHGTLLTHADLDRLRRALQPLPARWETHAVASAPMRIRNVGEGAGGPFAEALIRECLGMFPDADLRDDRHPDEASGTRLLRDVDWLLGRTPRFTWSLAGPGARLIRADVEHGRLAGGRVEGEAGARALAAGAWFDRNVLAGGDAGLLADLAALGDAARINGQ